LALDGLLRQERLLVVPWGSAERGEVEAVDMAESGEEASEPWTPGWTLLTFSASASLWLLQLLLSSLLLALAFPFSKAES
jgi:hypothetical protein